MLPEEAQGVSKHLDGPDPPSVDRLQLCLHGEVLHQTQPQLLKHYRKKKPSSCWE